MKVLRVCKTLSAAKHKENMFQNCRGLYNKWQLFVNSKSKLKNLNSLSFFYKQSRRIFVSSWTERINCVKWNCFWWVLLDDGSQTSVGRTVIPWPKLNIITHCQWLRLVLVKLHSFIALFLRPSLEIVQFPAHDELPHLFVVVYKWLGVLVNVPNPLFGLQSVYYYTFKSHLLLYNS